LSEQVEHYTRPTGRLAEARRLVDVARNRLTEYASGAPAIKTFAARLQQTGPRQ